ncbi:hypothetical protein Tco_1210372 [Tanacetum coccineum]
MARVLVYGMINGVMGVSMSSMISKKEIFYVGFKDQDTIQDVMNDKGWKWPHNWLVKYPWIPNIQCPKLSKTPHKAIWMDNNGNERNFSTNVLWKDVRGSSVKVCWSNLVWRPNCVPKHTFILWLGAKESCEVVAAVGYGMLIASQPQWNRSFTCVKAEFKIESIINKIREGRLRWFRHVRRRPRSAPVKRVESMAVNGLRRMGRPNLR